MAEDMPKHVGEELEYKLNIVHLLVLFCSHLHGNEHKVYFRQNITFRRRKQMTLQAVTGDISYLTRRAETYMAMWMDGS
jgi:hypothetical protein